MQTPTQKPGRYDHLRAPIDAYFGRLGLAVGLEPRGARGPDLEGVPGPGPVGEVKTAEEMSRDLSGYWSQWNSDRAFGGKAADYRLAKDLPGADRLTPGVRGCLAVLWGQLRGYVRAAGLAEEGPAPRADLSEALGYLAAAGKVAVVSDEVWERVRFVRVGYL